MKCIICSAEIDEARVVPPIEGPGGRLIDDYTGRLKLARDLERWTCASITAQVPGGCKTVRSGHLCPAHSVDDLTFALAPKVALPETIAAPAAAPAAKTESKTDTKGKS